MSRDMQRTVWALFGLAGLAVVLAGMYQNAYLFQDPFGKGLPELNVGASTLTLGLQVSAGVAVCWALVLSVLASPRGARVALEGWRRWVGAERVCSHTTALAVGVSVGYATARWATNEETVHATLEMLTTGTARTPFQYRALLPWLVRGIAEVVPGLSLPAIYGGIEAMAAFGVYVAFRSLLRSFVADAVTRRVAALIVFVPLVLNLATPYRYNAIFFPYDTASVAFFTAGLALLLRREWWAYYLLFVVATLNRETTCFLAVAYLFLAFGAERPARIGLHVVTQAAIWLGIKAGLHELYVLNETLGGGTGGVFSNQLARSGRILTAVPGLVYLGLMTMGGGGVVVGMLWRRLRDVRLRRLAGIVPLFFAGMVAVGELLEVRIYSELIPLVAVALLLIVRSVVTEAAARPIRREVMIAA